MHVTAGSTSSCPLIASGTQELQNSVFGANIARSSKTLNEQYSMLLPLRLGPVTISVAGYRGLAFEPLVNAAASGDDLAPALLSITEQFGFEGFAHGFVLRLRPEAEGEVFLFSTYSIEWMREYDQRAYVEVDPRVKACASTALPVIWDQSTFRGQSRIVDAFLDAALANGIGSGVSIGTRSARGPDSRRTRRRATPPRAGCSHRPARGGLPLLRRQLKASAVTWTRSRCCACPLRV